MRLERAGALEGAAVDRALALNLAYDGAHPRAVFEGALAEFPGEVALVSSFGADSVVLLHMASQIDRHMPILMIDTLMLFQETIAYQAEVAERLGLTGVIRLTPAAADLAAGDPDGTLNRRDPDACCDLRKVRPLERVEGRWPVTVTGRKRFQGATRATLDHFEPEAGRVKVNPLAHWSGTEVRAYMELHDLPRHPLVARGFRSIGCAPCTTPVAEGEDERAGRWRGTDKVECGIHFGPDGRIRRAS
ncbi:phosphoadenylyl-sulfate reductase [Amaricoccus sp.]|uniref:phosphoadenylyl-sulfate reductase n=1 Tax=Amaricoccus sp. TaxID=1872485 RepID=UPI001B3DC08F|nr:phosphoadenylyl-sulfate reductase [Amaricoccus sp.]MBP7001279.1 phosphoadenylyl-sulfate reductase [Amaricoccus sp.]